MKIYRLLFLLLFCSELLAQSGSEILLFGLKNQTTLVNGMNITNHSGYDNQPSFIMGSRSRLFYTSFNDSGRADIKVYDIFKKTTTNFTNTHDREYSPVLTPDEKHISCILQRDNGSQDLVQYPIKGGEPQVLINTLKVGYHAWVDDHRLLLFVLEDSSRNTLHFYDLRTQKDTVLAENPGRCLAKIPGEFSMSFVQVSKDGNTLCAYDYYENRIRVLGKTLPGKDQYAWYNGHTIYMSDGKDIFVAEKDHLDNWTPLTIEGDRSSLKGITRLAVYWGLKYSYMAVVVAE